MSYLVSQTWGWLLVFLILGAFAGWFTCADQRTNWFKGWLPFALVGFVLALIAALFAILPGRPGLWLELGLLLFTAYIIGCCLGCWLRQAISPPMPAALMAAAPQPAPAQTPAPPPQYTPAPAPAPTAPNPAPAAKLPDEDKHEGARPGGFTAPRGAKADDLKRIRGIGPQNEARLHALGVWHFDQIAAWSHDNVLWVGSYLSFPGRIDREKWLEQAAVLAKGLETDFSKRVDAGEVATSKDSGDKGQGNIARHDPKK